MQGTEEYRNERLDHSGMTHQYTLQQLVQRIIALHHPHPLRVAINGIDAAGKTTLANELAPLLEEQGRVVIRASIDDFQRPRRERYRQGSDSPHGYYEDTFDYPSFQQVLLQPLGSRGNGQYLRAVFDVSTETPLVTREEHAPLNAILLVDGVFLLRPELDPDVDPLSWRPERRELLLLLFKNHWTDRTERRVAPDSVRGTLQVFKDRLPSLCTRVKA